MTRKFSCHSAQIKTFFRIANASAGKMKQKCFPMELMGEILTRKPKTQPMLI